MRRITVKEVKAAYEKTKLRPEQFIYVGLSCGCPLAALAIANGADNSQAEIINWAHEVYGDQYANGFTRGFDGLGHNGTSVRSKRGYADGRQVAVAVLEPSHA